MTLIGAAEMLSVWKAYTSNRLDTVCWVRIFVVGLGESLVVLLSICILPVLPQVGDRVSADWGLETVVQT